LGLAVELVPPRFALVVGHHLEEKAVGGAGIEQRQDMGMRKARGGLDLLDEAVGADHGSQLRLQNLERDLPLVLEGLRQIDGGRDEAGFQGRIPMAPLPSPRRARADRRRSHSGMESQHGA
jgi:hypothetical protein